MPIPFQEEEDTGAEVAEAADFFAEEAAINSVICLMPLDFQAGPDQLTASQFGVAVELPPLTGRPGAALWHIHLMELPIRVRIRNRNFRCLKIMRIYLRRI
jgi:hypothetical protein